MAQAKSGGSGNQLLASSESLQRIRTLKKNPTQAQVAIHGGQCPVRQDEGSNKAKAVNITRFGPIGQVGNVQIGGFGRSLKAMKPSQSYLGGSQANQSCSQFSILSPKVIPIDQHSSQEISPQGGSPECLEDIPVSLPKETDFDLHLSSVRETKQRAEETMQDDFSKLSSSRRSFRLKSPQTADKIKKMVEPLHNISNSLQHKSKGKTKSKNQQRATKNPELQKQYLEDENPYTPVSKMKNKLIQKSATKKGKSKYDMVLYS